MPKAYVIAHVTFTNQEAFMSDYASKVGAIVNDCGGRFLVRAGEVSHAEGDQLGDISVVIEFPDRESAHAWNNSLQYREIVPARDQNANINFMIVDGVPDGS
jgi:uncharacterized protein (DUF1330 family)|tara:strand:+ start:154 stop:459 length:306 start_codon:yes stop_codon:yes gene_type:complete